MPELITKTSKRSVAEKTFQVALVGNPNTGKSSLFNALTGLRQKVANYPGVTIEKKSGIVTTVDNKRVEIHDLPGLYSLIPKSEDDRITIDILQGHSNRGPQLDLVVIIADAANLSRNLYLVTQILDAGHRIVLALNMTDSANKYGISVDHKALSRRLGIPVVPTVASKSQGIDALLHEISASMGNRTRQTKERVWTIEKRIQTVLQPIHNGLMKASNLPERSVWAETLRVVSNDGLLEGLSKNGHTRELGDAVRQARTELQKSNFRWQTLEATIRYRWIDAICMDVIKYSSKSDSGFSRKLDRLLTHRIGGPFIFLAIFTLIFQSIFSWAEIPMNAIEMGIQLLGETIRNFMPDGVLQDLTVNGAITGVGAVLVFLPQILFLFFFLALLEDTGYMARVAFMLDRLMRALGLSGRSVIPLISSFACAIPGIMATRTIPNWRDRLITIMIAPLMTCSARLPVFTLMIGAFIPAITVAGFLSLPALVLLSMYLLGIFTAVIAALVMNRILKKDKVPATFVMELPPYRLPSFRLTLLKMFERAKIFITTAGKIILAMSIVLWFLASYPKVHDNSADPGEAIRQSYAGQLGRTIEPAIKPLGFDWKIGIGLITSFAAREVMVSTLATIYNVENSDETSTSLRAALANETNPETGKPLYTPLIAISLMVFFVLACQCMSTVAIVKRETNSWRWPIAMIAYMTLLAYLGSLCVYQFGSFMGWG